MIFGFNTDIKVDNTVYHVQSEAREAEKLLQTQVFVKGHCIGKHAVSYAAQETSGQTEENRHDLLRDQHRHIVQAIREGHLDSIIESASVKLAANIPPASATAAANNSAQAPATPNNSPIELKFLGSSRPSLDSLVIRFGVVKEGVPISGAILIAQIMSEANAAETFASAEPQQGTTNSEGLVELALRIPENAQGEANLVVQVNHGGVSVAKKFRIKSKA